MNKEEADALIGQLSADCALRDALVIALMEHLPGLHSAIEAKVAATAPAIRLGLAPGIAAHFDQRMAEVLHMVRSAHT